MQLLIYNLLFPLALLFMLPRFLLRMIRRGKYRHKFGQRFGIYSRNVRDRIASRPRIWMHAVSVGEVLIAKKVIGRLRHAHPELGIVLSTTTSTGFTLARENAPEWLEVIYNPIDFRFFVRSALRTINPRLLVLVEAEVWPNLVSLARHRAIPVALVSARLSPRSERRYRKFLWFTKPFFAQLDLVCVQEPEDVARWTALGTRPECTIRAGSVKFDQETARMGDPSQPRAMLNLAGCKPDAPILLGASTHPKEERILAQAARKLRESFPDLYLVLVPRHVERAAEIEAELTALGCRVALRSRLGEVEVHRAGAAPIASDTLLVDATGELLHWYEVATVVFVGKSLAAHGGQNPVEPAAAGRAVVVGPHMENFDAVIRMLLKHEAIRQVRDTGEFTEVVRSLLADPTARERMASRATDALLPHQGATERTCVLVSALLSPSTPLPHPE